jgi:hypothetical protein
MKLFLVFVVAFIAGAIFTPAQAATVEQQALIAHMVSECSGVMGQAVCRVENNDKRDCASAADQMACRLAAFNNRYPSGLLVAGAGRFTAAEYFQFVDAGEKMCDVIVLNCSKDYDSRGCLMARALWRQK